MVGFSVRRARRKVAAAGTAAAAVLLGLAFAGGPAQAATQGPCDLYAAGGTPCVAAHSTTRALYGSYGGPLYQVRRASDGGTRDIAPTSAGGVADAASQDSFCAGTSCVITIIYDQSGRNNRLTQAPPGGFSGPAAGGYDNLANATAAPTTVFGRKAYGVYVAPGTGYRNNATNGIARGDQPEGMYAVFDGTHYNGGCCFDYGNAETNSRDNGNGTMEAIYFGNIKVWGYGTGNGPWIMADLENGLFSGVNPGYNANDPSISHRYLTAIVKGEPNHWAIRGGNAQSGGLSTFYNGARPNASGYNPMKKEGAIILGIGGDNSIGAAGTFYEGVMTSGYPSDATENAVQANIVAAGYANAPLPAALTPGSRIALRATTACCTGDYVQHSATDTTVAIAPVSSSSSSTDRGDATWIVRAGLAAGSSSCVSFESANASGRYLRHYNYRLYLQPSDGSSLFAQDATFCPQSGNSGQGYSFQSVNYPTKFLRHYSYTVYIASNGGSNTWDATGAWAADTSWVVAAPWA
jgi:non-reducing end alpha-L-arabinofuranosidase